jgi:hypothetical protein
MIQLPAKTPIKINRRGLTELVLSCAFLSLLTFALWSWRINGYVEALSHQTASGAPDSEASLIPLILRSPAIMASTVASEFVVLLAILLAIVPLSWWLRSEYLVAGANQRLMTPLRWLGGKFGLAHPKQEAPKGEYVMNEAGELTFVPTRQEEMEAEQEVVMVQQPDGTLMAMVQQADGTLVPAPPDARPKEENKEGKEGEAQPGETPIPGPQQPNSVLNFDETQEEDPLADLADIGDILSSAFDDDNAIDPEIEAISRTLQEIDIDALVKNARNVLATFKQ